MPCVGKSDGLPVVLDLLVVEVVDEFDDLALSHSWVNFTAGE